MMSVHCSTEEQQRTYYYCEITQLLLTERPEPSLRVLSMQTRHTKVLTFLLMLE